MDYIFNEFTSSIVKTDPVFNDSKFTMFGDPASSESAPVLFWVKNCRYLLVNPNDNKVNNHSFLFKAACFLFYHLKTINDKSVVYFIGDINLGDQIKNKFSNQIIKLVSYEEIENWYPKNIDEIICYFVRYLLKQQTHYGQRFSSELLNSNYLLFVDTQLTKEEQKESFDYIKNNLFNQEFLHKVGNSYDNQFSFLITEKAINRFQETRYKTNKKAFIAIKFGNENADRIKTIKEVVSSCGYEPVCMDEFQTNNWIMPEIFYQIKICDFMVADFSIECAGVYYEAGYALALNKPVIHSFDETTAESNNQRLHFDISQKSTVMYKNLNDLKERLARRIIATIGTNEGN